MPLVTATVLAAGVAPGHGVDLLQSWGESAPPQAPSAASIVNNARGQHQNARCPVREGCGCWTGPLGSR